jgi:hypothetical protein
MARLPASIASIAREIIFGGWLCGPRRFLAGLGDKNNAKLRLSPAVPLGNEPLIARFGAFANTRRPQNGCTITKMTIAIKSTVGTSFHNR